MKRWIWAAVVVGAGAWWLLPTSADVAMITAIHPDGTIEWVDGEYRRAEENNSAVYPLSETPHVSKLLVRTSGNSGGSATGPCREWETHALRYWRHG
ncbi:hypothetical protein [Amycolatopsis sp. NPDC051128]|uniref:hypothetical protein n=1 Tax=Amycolatopsis sp. NPDC051128 TaxID=3155412 RepID=UPI00341D1393